METPALQIKVKTGRSQATLRRRADAWLHTLNANALQELAQCLTQSTPLAADWCEDHGVPRGYAKLLVVIGPDGNRHKEQ